MASHNVVQPIPVVGRPDARRRGNYYNPPTAIKDVPGVVKKVGINERCDFYSGTAEALIAAGLLPAELFPGQPERNISAQAYRPVGVERQHNKQGWYRVPGYMHVTRTASGKFQIRLTVSQEKQERRATLREEADEADEAQRSNRERPRATPEEIQAYARNLLGVIVDNVGVEEVQRLLDALKPRRPRPRPNYLQVVVSNATCTPARSQPRFLKQQQVESDSGVTRNDEDSV